MAPRSLKKTVLVWMAAWVLGISLLHAGLNLDVFRARGESAATQFRVGFIPVT